MPRYIDNKMSTKNIMEDEVTKQPTIMGTARIQIEVYSCMDCPLTDYNEEDEEFVCAVLRDNPIIPYRGILPNCSYLVEEEVKEDAAEEDQSISHGKSE